MKLSSFPRLTILVSVAVSVSLWTGQSSSAQGQGGGQTPWSKCCIQAHEDIPTGCSTPCILNNQCNGISYSVAVAGTCYVSDPQKYCTSSGSTEITTHQFTCQMVDCDEGKTKCEWTVTASGIPIPVAECSGSGC